MYPHYSLPPSLIVQVTAAMCLRQRRCLRADASRLIDGITPPLQVTGREYIPLAGPYLITVNHYMRPGFNAMWLALAISAVTPVEIHWTITAAWRFEGRPWSWVARPLSRFLLGGIAAVYGLTPMPAMPPDPREVQARVDAVRRLLAYARRTPDPVIGLAPEGRDFLGGALGRPAPGVGRLVLQLTRLGLRIAPVGVYEDDGALHVRFGPAYSLETPAAASADERDRIARRVIMEHIAALLPEHLRGEFS